MTTNFKRLNIDADTPGVRTTVKQTVDFGELTDTQLRRVVRAVERGHTARSGYVTRLVRAAAKQLGVAPPVQISGATVSPLPEELYGKAFADLIKVSDVRYQLWLSQHPNHQRSVYWSGRKSGWRAERWGNPLMLTLWGWQEDGAGLRAEVEKVLRRTSYYKDLGRLAEFIRSRPKFEVM